MLKKARQGMVISLAMLVVAFCGYAGTCGQSVSGTGQAMNNEALAKHRAKEDWRVKALSTCGQGYQHWLKSDGKQMHCSRSGSVGNRTWTCIAVSTPIQ